MKVLKFGATWCSDCLIMKPLWAEIEKENSWLKTEYYDADSNEALIKEYKVTNLPCFIFLDKENKELYREYGEVEKDVLINLISKYKDL